MQISPESNRLPEQPPLPQNGGRAGIDFFQFVDTGGSIEMKVISVGDKRFTKLERDHFLHQSLFDLLANLYQSELQPNLVTPDQKMVEAVQGAIQKLDQLLTLYRGIKAGKVGEQFIAQMRTRLIDLLKEMPKDKKILEKILRVESAKVKYFKKLYAENEILAQAQGDKKAVEVTRGMLADDFTHHLRVNSNEEFQTPLDPKESLFISEYLKNQKGIQLQRIQYALIQRETEHLENRLEKCKVICVIEGEEFEIYDLDLNEAVYRFVGTAANIQNVYEDYVGYCAGKWHYLCASIIDREHAYYDEFSRNVFQVFSIPPEAIIHTSEEDIYSPEASHSKQKEWYGLAQRAMVLAAHVDAVYEEFRLLRKEKNLYKGPSTPLVTAIDQYHRLTNELMRWISILENHEQDYVIDHFIKSLWNKITPNERNLQIKKAMSHLKRHMALERKEEVELESLLTALQAAASDLPPNFNPLQHGYWFNRVWSKIREMERYYMETDLSPEENKTEFTRLFQVKESNDEKVVYDIKGEIKKIERLLENIPKEIKGINPLQSSLNRLMGPNEVLSQTKHGLYNEINIDTRKGNGIHVKAWIIPKDLFEKEKISYAFEEYLRSLFSFAKSQHIPVLIRSELQDEIEHEF